MTNEQELQQKVTQRLQTMIGSMHMTIAQLTVERDSLREEVERLTAELESRGKE